MTTVTTDRPLSWAAYVLCVLNIGLTYFDYEGDRQWSGSWLGPVDEHGLHVSTIPNVAMLIPLALLPLAIASLVLNVRGQHGAAFSLSLFPFAAILICVLTVGIYQL